MKRNLVGNNGFDGNVVCTGSIFLSASMIGSMLLPTFIATSFTERGRSSKDTLFLCLVASRTFVESATAARREWRCFGLKVKSMIQQKTKTAPVRRIIEIEEEASLTDCNMLLRLPLAFPFTNIVCCVGCCGCHHRPINLSDRGW